ncbi:hypothetical protein LCGC14_2362190, partial [marine sediment metagenome]
SMILKPSSLNESFKPYIISRTGRSAIPDDFNKEDIDYFLLILPLISNPWLKARLSDLIWLQRRSEVNLALAAIDSYIMVPITLESFKADGGYCWIRALQLTRILKNAAGERIKNIQDRILEAIRNSSEKDGFLAKWLADLLKKFRLGINYENEIAEKLISLASEFNLKKDFYRARDPVGSLRLKMNKKLSSRLHIRRKFGIMRQV